MKTLHSAPLLDDGAAVEAEALIEEARRRQRRRHYSVACAAVLVVAGLIAYFAQSGSNTPKIARATTLAASTPSPFVNARAFHGHGNLAFVSRGALYVLDGQTNHVAAVTGEAASAITPSFSPNGKWLAYGVGQGGAGVARADGSAPRTITTTGGGPNWLPNGELLVGTTLYRVSSSDQVQRAGSAPNLVAWATDGSGYAFIQRVVKNGANGAFSGVEQLQLASSLTGKRTVWRSTPVSFSPPSGGFHGNVVNGVMVLPHHEGVLFWVDPDQSDAADGMHVYELRSPGATPIDLGVTIGKTVSIGTNGVLAIGSGGNRYAWMTKNIETCVIATARCSVVHTPSGELTFDPAWAPNGKTLAFVEAPPSSVGNFFQSTLTKWYLTHHLWLLSSGSSEPTEVKNSAGASVPVWSSNGRSLIYESADSLWIIPSPGANPTKIAAPLFPTSAWPSYYGQITWSSQFSWSAAKV
ncbi:MAG: putative signaling protein [Acidimicrobiaceae bacterium]|nr:putative signaling protein [Acidimicrobiaceae bacterium]